ncbi:MAG: hypothetical protein MZW92_50385 [Comamonadaceae bacterium]|nr:hypothetical protein [Comamonadaceae bacterium]
MKFLEAAHVKDLLALLRWADNPRRRLAGLRVARLVPGIGPAQRAAAARRDGRGRRPVAALAAFAAAAAAAPAGRRWRRRWHALHEPRAPGRASWRRALRLVPAAPGAAARRRARAPGRPATSWRASPPASAAASASSTELDARPARGQQRRGRRAAAATRTT